MRMIFTAARFVLLCLVGWLSLSAGAADVDGAEAGIERASPSTHSAAPIDELVAPLQQRLQQQPDDVDGWVLLGRSLHFLHRWQAASEAFARARALGWQGEEPPADAGPHGILDPAVAAGVRETVERAPAASDGAAMKGSP